MSKVAKVVFSLDLLETLLPAGSKIISFQANEYHHTVEVFIEHDSFAENHPGEFPPQKTLMCRRHWCKTGDHNYNGGVEYAS